ncbi:PspC domain-containing protein [Demequina globuliformis]|uniref:PspC domain-containing protein n=1 Tax=Demequina globuliformis TaxID=676202 RepID=UPI00078431ED|nr:PspC domain-containing protein [Demequina globuliformis]
MSENPQPPKEAAFFTAIRDWELTRSDRGLGGVASGLGARVGMAPAPARLITIVAAVILPGVVLLAYAAAWGLLPDRRGSIVIQDFGRGITNVGALLGIAVMAVLGFASLDSGGLLNWWGGGYDLWWIHDAGPFELLAAFFAIVIPLAVLGGLVFLIVYLVRRSKASGQVPPGTPAAGTTWSSAQEPQHGGRAAGPASAQPSDVPASAPGEEPSGATAPVKHPSDSSDTSANEATDLYSGDPAKPQPWEPALTPGDPRAGLPPAGPGKRASARRNDASAYAWSTSTGQPAPAPAPAYTPPLPPRAPRVPGPGKGAWLALLGVALLSGAGVIIAERVGDLTVAWPLAWFAGFAVGLGLILVVVALSGRRLGFLGFVSVLVAIAGVAFSANSDDLRAAYDDASASFGWTYQEDSGYGIEPTPGVDEPDQISVAEAFGDDYSTMYIEGACYDTSRFTSDEEWSMWFGYDLDPTPNAVNRYDAVDDDTSATLRAEVTDVTMPAGTSLHVTGVSGQFIVWPDREVYCEIWSDVSDGPVVELVNPDTPVLTLSAYEGGTIIVNEEVTP